MSYRDERDALHARNEALEHEVHRLREQNQRAEREIEQLRSGEEVEPELIVPRAKSTIHKGAVITLLATSALLFTGIHMLRAARAPRASAVLTQQVVTWRAEVVTSTVADVAEGSRCALTYAVDLDQRRLARAPVTLRCGAHEWLQHALDVGATSSGSDTTVRFRVENAGQLFEFSEAAGQGRVVEGAGEVHFRRVQ